MHRRWLVLAVLASTLLVIALDATVLNVALPTLAADLDPTGTELLWIVDAYGLVLAGLLVAAAGLGDRLGRRRVLVAGLGLFAVAAVVAAAASTPEQLIGARVLLGVGGALVMPSTLAVLRSVFPDDRERAIAIGVWSGVAAGGFAVGPIVGGALLEAASWEWLFLAQVPVVLLALVASLRFVPESRAAEPGPFDPLGVALSIGGMGALVWGIKHDLDPAWLAAGAVGLALFARRQVRAAHPMLDVRLFRDRRFAVATGVVLGTFLGLGALLLGLTQFLQLVQGHGPLEAGVRLLPLAGTVLLAAPATDALVRRLGTRAVMGGGFLLVAAALAVLSGLEATTPYPVIGLALAAVGVGAGFASTAASATIMAVAPADRASAAAAVQETAYELGGALGVATLGALLTTRFQDGLAGVPAAARESLPAAAEAAAAAGGEAGRALLAAAQASFLDALGTTVLAAAGLMAVVAVVAWVLTPRGATLRANPGPADGAAGARV
jgi:MFS transporter, DHA2 family, multidrug resistance protein